jgi:flagellar motor protein MotB
LYSKYFWAVPVSDLHPIYGRVRSGAGIEPGARTLPCFHLTCQANEKLAGVVRVGTVHSVSRRQKRERKTAKTVTLLASVLMSMALVMGCLDRTEQPLIQVQKDLEQVLRTAMLNGDIRMLRTRDHLTVMIAERLLFDAGSHEIKPDGIEVLKQMGVLFKAASFKEIRVAGHADKASISDHASQYFERLARSKARATQVARVLKEQGVDSQSVVTEWYGDIRPIASNETQEGQRMNRRVEIVLHTGTRADTLLSGLLP